MRNQLVVFNGGLQTKVAPHLVAPNQAIECENVRLDKGSIFPYEGWLQNDVAVTGTNCMQIGDSVVSNNGSSDIRSYAMFNNRLYWSDGDSTIYGIHRWNGTAEVDAVPPTVTTFGTMAVPASGVGQLNGVYSYVYTVVDTDGIESVPSPVFTTATLTNNDVEITFALTGESVTETVSKRRIYRTGGSNPTFNLIAELDAAYTTYLDETADLDVSRIELTTFNNYAPPASLLNLSENNATMWGSVGDRVYFSANGQPEFWNPLDFIVLNDTCTGIGTFRNITIAFTESDAYAISGFSRDNIVVEKLPYNEGCTNDRSIANVADMLLWASKNGICAYNGNTVEVITRNLLSWSDGASLGDGTFDSFTGTFDSNTGNNIVHAIGVNGKYYAVSQTGIGVFDISSGVLASSITLENVSGLYYNYDENMINAVDSDLNVYSLERDTENNLTAKWKTPELSDDAHSVLKQYRRVKLDTTPTRVSVWVNGRLVTVKDKKREFYLPSGTIGNTIQFQIETDVEVKSIRYDYGVING